MELELQDIELRLMQDSKILTQMLSVIEDHRGILDEKSDSCIFSNLIELQDSLGVLPHDYYFEDIASSLAEFSEKGKQILKRFGHFPLRSILIRTLEKCDLYLTKIKNPKYQKVKYNEPSLKAKIDQELGKRADALLKDASNQIIVEELSKQLYKINNRGKTIAQLSESKEKTLDEKLDLAANTLILSQLRRRGR